MPVHRDREKKKITAEEMEVEEQEQDASSSEEEDSDTSSVSEDGDSSGGNLWNCSEHKHNVLKQMMVTVALKSAWILKMMSTMKFLKEILKFCQ